MNIRLTRPAVALVIPFTLASVALNAQGGRVGMTSQAAKQMEEQVGKAAEARGLILTDAAKKAIVQEAVHQEVAAVPPAMPSTPIVPDTKLNQLVTTIAASAGTASKLDEREVQKHIDNAKVQQVTSTLPADIVAHAAARGLMIPDDVRQKMIADFTKQSDLLSKSGLSVDVIRQRNEASLRAFDAAIGTNSWTPEYYQVAFDQIFTKQVMMSIHSVPQGADVLVGGVPIGKTNVDGKPFEPGDYTFMFRLAGYRSVDRAFPVTPSLEPLSLEETLVANDTASSAQPPKPSLSPNTQEHPSPWKYVAIAATIVAALLAFIALRKS
jgi:PEGA domain-containing protein